MEAICSVLMPVMSAHFMSPTLAACVLSKIPFSSMMSPMVLSNIFLMLNTAAALKNTMQAIPAPFTRIGLKRVC